MLTSPREGTFRRASPPVQTVRRLMPHDALLTLHSLIVNRFDYFQHSFCLSAGSPCTMTAVTISAKYSCSSIVFSARKNERITLLMRELNWLKIKARIQFNLCLKVTASLYPVEDLNLVAYISSRCLRFTRHHWR
jgi:hypothetical protein